MNLFIETADSVYLWNGKPFDWLIAVSVKLKTLVSRISNSQQWCNSRQVLILGHVYSTFILKIGLVREHTIILLVCSKTTDKENTYFPLVVLSRPGGFKINISLNQRKPIAPGSSTSSGRTQGHYPVPKSSLKGEVQWRIEQFLYSYTKSHIKLDHVTFCAIW